MVGFPSGQRDQTVNLTAQPSKVRILPQPPSKNNQLHFGVAFLFFLLCDIIIKSLGELEEDKKIQVNQELLDNMKQKRLYQEEEINKIFKKN